MVFDQKFIDSLPSLSDYNSQVVMLCRAPHLEALRMQVEEWFSQVPPERQPDLRGRLQSQRDDQHIGAFYELVLYRFCKGEGWDVQLNPVLSNGLTPDLQIRLLDGNQFLLEVYTLMDNQVYEGQQKTIILEDSNPGIASAKAAGAFTIGLRQNLIDGYQQVGADAYANTIDEVIALVDRQTVA